MRTPRGVTPGQVGFLIPADQNPEATDNVSMGSTADLTTEAVTNITETSATLNGTIDITSENCETPNNTEQGFVYSTEIQPTTDDIQVNVNGTNISTTIEGLTPNTT